MGRREQVAKVLVSLKWLKYRRWCVTVSCCCCCCVLLLWVWISSDERKWRVWTFGRLWLGRVGRTHFLLCSFVFVFVKQKKRKKIVCLTYSAHAKGFRFFLPLLTFSFFLTTFPWISSGMFVSSIFFFYFNFAYIYILFTLKIHRYVWI